MGTLIWIASIIGSTLIGSSKGEAGSGFVAGLVLGPLGLILAILSSGDRAKCPDCRETVKRAARICPHCRARLDLRRASGAVRLD